MTIWTASEAGGDPESATATEWDSRAFDPAGLVNQLDRRPPGAEVSIPRYIDERFAGEAARLTLPATDVTVVRFDVNAQYTLSSASKLPAGSYLLSMTTGASLGRLVGRSAGTERVRVYVRFDGPASLRPVGETTLLSFADQSEVTIGFETLSETRPTCVQVARSPAGLATGVTYMSVAHHTMKPSRSRPDLRSRPPLLTTGEKTVIPAAVRKKCPTTDIRLYVPDSLADVFVAAPLAYYLGAEVTVEPRDSALLTAENAAVDVAFEPLPSFQHGVARLLRKVFYLDWLVRGNESDDGRRSVASELSLDPDTVRSLSPAGRLKRYVDVPTAAVERVMPDWPLSTYVSPEIERAPCLPFLLDKLSLIYLPDSTELDRSDLLSRTLSDTYPSRGTRSDRPRILDPNLQAGRLHAWLAPGTPLDACKTLPQAYQNRRRYDGRDRDELQVSVVRNDVEMTDEHTEVSEIYRAADLPMNVTVSQRLSTHELAAVFESETDFVHFIGHCDDEGLRCPDGHLAVASLDGTRTRTFFLNACGSYEEGLALVEQGAVAGAVTFTDVLDRHAAMVGTAFARLLGRGFSIQRALHLARRRIVMGKDYAVVGDGTYSLLPSPEQPAVVWLTATEAGFDITCEVVSPERPGESYRLPFGDGATLNGERTTHSLDTAELADALAETSLPVIYDGEFHWSDDFATRLRNDRCVGR